MYYSRTHVMIYYNMYTYIINKNIINVDDFIIVIFNSSDM